MYKYFNVCTVVVTHNDTITYGLGSPNYSKLINLKPNTQPANRYPPLISAVRNDIIL